VSSQDERWLLEEKYGGEKSEAFFADLERLRTGEPLAYVIGHVPFLGCQIYLDSGPLIPRPETEFWVEKAIEKIKTVATPRVLDLCSGSGAIGVAVAKHCPAVRVVLSDVTDGHNNTVNRTIRENGVDERQIEVVNGDLFENISGRFDFIFSNPPYIDPALNRAESSVKAYEPHLALYGGQGGLDILKRLIEAAPKYLAPEGQIWLEHEPEQVEAIRQSAEACGFRATTYPDQYGVQRYSVLKFR
jgi:release factor glutamine methyltransferase